MEPQEPKNIDHNLGLEHDFYAKQKMTNKQLYDSLKREEIKPTLDRLKEMSDEEIATLKKEVGSAILNFLIKRKAGELNDAHLAELKGYMDNEGESGTYYKDHLNMHNRWQKIFNERKQFFSDLDNADQIPVSSLVYEPSSEFPCHVILENGKILHIPSELIAQFRFMITFDDKDLRDKLLTLEYEYMVKNLPYYKDFAHILERTGLGKNYLDPSVDSGSSPE
jgi:hypothetical protein